MTDDVLAAIRARAEATTPGPWKTAGAGGTAIYSEPSVLSVHVASDAAIADAAFIAYARTDVPALLAEIDRLRSLIHRQADHDCPMDERRVALIRAKERERCAETVRGKCYAGGAPCCCDLTAEAIEELK